MSLPARQLRHLTVSAEFVRPQLQPPALDRAVHGQNTPFLPSHSRIPGSLLMNSLVNALHIHWVSLTSVGFVFQPLRPPQSTNIPTGCRTAGALWRCASTATSPGNAPQTLQLCRPLCPAGIPGYCPQCPCALRSCSGLHEGFPPGGRGCRDRQPCKLQAANLQPRAPGTDPRPWHWQETT